MNHNHLPRISLLMTGSELMNGDTIDTNSAYIAKALLDIGLEIEQKITVGDNLTLLIKQLTLLSQCSDVVLINGGLGPTQDDLTAQAISVAFTIPLIVNSQAKTHVENWCLQRNITVNAANLKQATLPENATIFLDAPGSAASFYCYINGCLIMATPGVPSELKHILQHDIIPYLNKHFTFQTFHPWKKITLMGIGESRLQEYISTTLSHITPILDLGFRVNAPTVEFKYRPLPHIDINNKLYVNAQQDILDWLKPYIISFKQESIAEVLVHDLTQLNKTVCTAESCTGGLIAHLITQISGASAVFPGGVVSYSNRVKTQLLSVKEELLDEVGAVSKPVVESMLKGALHQFNSDYGIAVTGIAGPNGGTAAKPVGTVWIAWGSKQQMLSIQLCIPLPRLEFQIMVANIALDLLRRFIKGEAAIPHYLHRWQRAI